MITSRLDITQIFWDVDDFCNQWSRLWQKQKQLPSMPSEKRCPKGYRFVLEDKTIGNPLGHMIYYHPFPLGLPPAYLNYQINFA